jgi:hypothetical protein
MGQGDLIGYVASALVLATFAMKDMRRLRAIAILSNLAFIAYGALFALLPVLGLHLVLLPLNIWRLIQDSHSPMPRRWLAPAGAVAIAAVLAVGTGLAARVLTPSTGQVLTATASASNNDDIAVADTPFDDETAATRTSLADAGPLAKAAINGKKVAARQRRE